MLQPLLILTILLVALLIFLMVEALQHRHYRKQIPIRIHVNGTRGKSSVTRLIAAGLRAGHIRTCAKTTGTLPRFITPEGQESPIYRLGHTNIIEQTRIIRKAAKHHAQALVIECMALHPLLQALCELRLVRATHGVLTNARPDHLEIMGPTEKDVALALAGTVPVKGHYFTTERKHRATLKKAVHDRHSKMHALTAQQVDTITPAELAAFPYTEFKENVALALSVCQSFGIARDTALKGMWAATPDPGVLTLYRIVEQKQTLLFANAFAANDPVSTQRLWNTLLEQHPHCQGHFLIVNCRKDRPERSAQLGKAIRHWQTPHHILLVGNSTHIFTYYYHKGPPTHPTAPLTHGESWSAEETIQWLLAQKVSPLLAVGVGNIADIGLRLAHYCSTRQAS